MDARRSKAPIYEQLARIGKAVASPSRLELLEMLAQGPRTVESLADASSLSLANASQHLKVLRAARLVDAEKHGLYVEYRIADPAVERFVIALRELAEGRLAELEGAARAYLGEHETMESIDREELLRRIRAGEVTVIDVRPPEEYRAGHIPGAISLPLGELEQRLAELPKRREVVAYCRGPYCVMAVDAVGLLRGKGFRAHRMDLGVPDWRARGWPIESTT